MEVSENVKKQYTQILNMFVFITTNLAASDVHLEEHLKDNLNDPLILISFYTKKIKGDYSV